MKPVRVGIVAAVVFVTCSGASVWAQRGGGAGGGGQVSTSTQSGAGSFPSANGGRTSFPTWGRDATMTPMGMPDPLGGRLAEQQAKVRNSERQKKLQSDTDKLVDLVNELKNQVGTESTLSPSELSKRAEEIEKLAKSVKERMKG